MPKIWAIAPIHYEYPDDWERIWKYDLANNVISIGWNRLKNIGRLSKSQLLALYKIKYKEDGDKKAETNTNTLFRFIHDIQPGDIIVARKGRKVIASIGIATSRPYYDSKAHSEPYPKGGSYPYHVDVEWNTDHSEISFAKQVFGMQAIHEVPLAKYNKLISRSSRRRVDQIEYPDEVLPNILVEEGGFKLVYVNAIERNRSARNTCISKKGFRCSVCDMLFEERYGDIGKHYIHVHHLVPVSTRLEKYKLNPLTDLSPVCPNCHAMLHTSNPPLSIESLREIYCANN